MKALIIGTGSIKGFVYTGGVSALNKYMGSVRYYAGCSIGSLLTFLLCIGVETEEIVMRFIGDGFFDIAELSPDLFNKPITGIFSLKPLREKLHAICHDHLGIDNPTFRDVFELTRGRTFICVATNMKTGRPDFFSRYSTPEQPCIDAICKSCNIPGVFEPIHEYDGVYVDGAVSEPTCLEEVAKRMKEDGVLSYRNKKGAFPENFDIITMYLTRRNYTHQYGVEYMPINGSINMSNPLIAKIESVFGSYRRKDPELTISSDMTLEEKIKHMASFSRQLYGCFTENANMAHIMKEQLLVQKKYPYKAFLLSLPSFNNMLSANAEEKTDMYFAGRDVVKYYLELYGE
jgi:predicted acylesterase/phospholipase RssA